MKLSTGILLLVLIAGGGASAVAQRETLVLLRIDDCPRCERMESVTLPQLQRDLPGVDIIQRNVDHDDAALKLAKGVTYPQLILFSERDGQWRETARWTGFFAAGEIEPTLRGMTK